MHRHVIIFWMSIAAIPMMLIAAIPIASSFENTRIVMTGKRPALRGSRKVRRYYTVTDSLSPESRKHHFKCYTGKSILRRSPTSSLTRWTASRRR
jgi:hypothetical protein